MIKQADINVIRKFAEQTLVRALEKAARASDNPGIPANLRARVQQEWLIQAQYDALQINEQIAELRKNEATET